MEEKQTSNVTNNDNLGIFSEIDLIDAQVKKQKRNILILIVLIFIIIIAGGSYIMNLTSGPSESEQQAVAELERIKTELSEMQAHSQELENLLKETQSKLEGLENDAEESSVFEEEPINEPTTYIVKEGESLWTLAEKFYGSGDYYEKLGLDNDIIDPEHLIAGLELTVNPK